MPWFLGLSVLPLNEPAEQESRGKGLVPRFGRRSSEAFPLNEPIRPVDSVPLKLSGRP